MKRVKYLKPRVGNRGSIPVGTTDVLHDDEAEKLADRGEAEILETIAEPAKTRAATAPEGDEPTAPKPEKKQPAPKAEKS